MTNPKRNTIHSIALSRPLPRRAAFAPGLLIAALASLPAQAGIQYGRDDFSNAQPYNAPVCTPQCSNSETCTALTDLSDDPTGDTSVNICLNNSYPFTFMGEWQAYGRIHHVGDVMLDPQTGNAFIFVDVSVPPASSGTSNFLIEEPMLTDTTSWQPFTGLVSGALGSEGPQGPQGPAGAQGATGPQGNTGDTGPLGPAGAAGAVGAPGNTGPMGPQGGTGATGMPGNTGNAGPMGPQGAMGAPGQMGSAGMPGLQGATGPAGAMGAQGPKGATGAAGVAGPAGQQGATGAAGAGLFSGAMVLVPSGVTIPAGFSCLPEEVRFRHDDEDEGDHHRARIDDDDSRWYRLCAKN